MVDDGLGTAGVSCGGGPGRRTGWDAFLAAVRTSSGRGGHRGGVEGGDMTVVTDHDAGAVGGEPVAGDHDPVLVAMSKNVAPTGRDTATVAAASSGGTEYRLPR